MSEVGRYRLVFPRIWRHAGFRSLSPSSRLVALYLLTGPQGNRLGLFHLSPASAADDLKVAIDTFRKGLADVAQTFGWTFDGDAGVFYIPSWWRWNKPQNENVLRGCLKDLNEIAPSPLVEAFARNLRTLPETFHLTFAECCRQRLVERPTIQEPFPNLSQQKHNRRASRGSDGRGLDRPTDEEQQWARITFDLASPDRPMEELVETYRHVDGRAREVPKTRIVNALNLLLSERRVASA